MHGSGYRDDHHRHRADGGGGGGAGYPGAGGYGGGYPGGGAAGPQAGYPSGGYGGEAPGGYQQGPPVGAGDFGQDFYPEPQAPSLTEAVRAFTTGAMPAEEFQGIFAAATIYCPRGDSPGFLALHNTPQPVIPMFSTLEELRRYAGKESRHFELTGAEVLDLLPTGYGFVLDLEGDHRMVFDAKAVEQMVDFTMRRMYG